MKKLSTIAAGAVFALSAMALSMPASAQSMSNDDASPNMSSQYMDARCGSWHGGTWESNGTCAHPIRHERIAGTIVAVRGHMVTVQQTTRRVVINDMPALNRQTSGQVAVGRAIVARGYWRNGQFYATLIR